MNKRLIVIITVGAIVIAATYMLTRAPEEAAPPAPIQSSAVKATDATADTTEAAATQAETTDPEPSTASAATSTTKAEPDSQSLAPTAPTASTPIAATAIAGTPIAATVAPSRGSSTAAAGSIASATGATTTGSGATAVGTTATPQVIPSTDRENAKLLARATTTSDPFTAVLSYKPFPSSSAKPANKDPMNRSADPTKSRSSHKNGTASHHRIPPPPPGFAAPPPASSIDMAQLPIPPAPPTVADKLKVVGIVGDKAIISVNDTLVRHEYKWSKLMTVGSGDILGPVTVIAVKSDSVTFEEDGTRTEKELAPVR